MNLSYSKPYYFFALVLAVFWQPAIADNSISSAEHRRSSDPYCGIYCLYAVMKLSDINVGPTELLKPEYISSHRGSSLAELKKAAEDYGLYAIPVGKLTTRELRQSPYPVILHIKSAADKKQYDHYELFWETKDGQARLYNPPEPARLVPFHELAPRWDGTGLIVSPEPIDVGSIFAPARRRFIMYAAAAIAAILMMHWGRRRWLVSVGTMSRRRLLGLSIAQCAGLILLAISAGIIYHFANDEGFLANPNATASIQQAHLGNFIPKVSSKKAGRLLNTDTVFIDARYARDFDAGHLKGANNVPVSASDDERQKAMADVAKDTRIVVYSQSAGCPFAENMAIKLTADGFSNVSIFKDGWHEWAAKTDK